MTGLAILTALSSLQYVTTNVAVFDPIFRDKYAAHLPIIITHGVCAITALVLGPFQFIPRLRARVPKLHRAVGCVYLLAVLGGGLTGFHMGAMAFGGLPAQVAFCMMAGLWLATGGEALRSALSMRINDHRGWMIRNYALTFGAVTLRLYLTGFQMIGVDYETIYPAVAWLAWVPNLVAAEILIGTLRFNKRNAKKLFPSSSYASSGDIMRTEKGIVAPWLFEKNVLPNDPPETKK